MGKPEEMKPLYLT